jgi:uncharacterized RDD family membrane protein YckC
MTSRTGHEDGVLFQPDDYAGMLRRTLAIVIDCVVLWLTWVPIAWIWYRIIRPGEEPLSEAYWSWLAVVYLYLAMCKPSPLRTVGYWIAGVKIVDFRGNSPGFLRMTFRFLLWIVGPFNLVVDWLWLGGDTHKQTLRDKFAGTYVVRSRAEPIGMNYRRTAYYNFAGVTLMFAEVQPLTTDTE